MAKKFIAEYSDSSTKKIEVEELPGRTIYTLWAIASQIAIECIPRSFMSLVSLTIETGDPS